jgi:NADPH:quinone reductase-like Zn-dependent oxidoreductase/acyl carrier protein
LKEILYENEINLKDLGYIGDHRIYGTVIFPGTGYIEIALAAAKATYGNEGYIISDLSIQQPIIFTSEGSRSIQVVLMPEGPAEATFKVFSQGDIEDEWLLHVQGRLSVEKVVLPESDLSALQARFVKEEDAPARYEKFKCYGLEYGPTFQGMKRLFRGDYETLGLISTLDAEQVQGYQIHPALLDSCLHLLDSALPGDDKDKIFLPFNLKQLRVRQKPAGHQIWCHISIVEKNATSQNDNFTTSLRVFDETGDVIAEFEELLLRRTNRDILRMAMQSRIHEWMYKTDWIPAPFDADTPLTTPGRWLIFADQSGVGEAAAAKLQAQGASCELVFAAEDYESNGHHEHRVNPGRPEDFSALMNKIEDCTDVLYLWAIDAAPDDVEMGKLLGTTGALHLAQAMAVLTSPPLLWLATRGAKHVGVETTTPIAFSQRPIWGFARTLGQEYPTMLGGLIDLDGNITEATIDLLVDILTRRDGESQVALRGPDRYAARFVHSVEKSAMKIPQGQPFALDITTRGILDNLVLQPIERPEPGPNQVEVSVRATGLNFRDVLNALGMYPGDAGPLGSECAGVVTRIGANVTNLAPGDLVIALVGGAFRSHVVAEADFCFPMPPNMTFAESMTLPLTFLTSYYGLHELAGMKAGDKVLIHAAAGGVGLAAVQLALRVGAEVFGTAGSEEKRAYLKSLGVHHVLNSRTLDFADEIMHITNRKGVNIVLNSLNDEFITKSMGVLADGGIFLEIGKRGVWTTEQVAAFNPTLSYHLYDLVEVMLGDRPLTREMMFALLADFEAGHLVPLPLKVFPINEVGEAFRYMAQAKHIGKIAVTQQPVEILPDATYLITGGLGGLGLEVGQWLVQRGAKHIVLMGRKSPSKTAQKYIDTMQVAGAQVEIAHVDVADADQVAEMLQQINRNMPPLRGIIHAAGVLDDGVIVQQTAERFETVMASKVTGTMNLHRMTSNLDFFVMFSSASATLGSGGQSNYAAANAFLDGLAHARRARGLPAISINWGAWSQVGMAASLENRLADVGMGSIAVDQGLQALDYILNQSGITQVAVVPMNWTKQLSQFKPGNEPAFLCELARIYRAKSTPQAAETVDTGWLERLKNAEEGSRLDIALSYTKGQIAKVLRLSNPESVDPHISLSNMGLDSLMAMELRNRVESDLKVTIAVTELLEGPTPAQISEMIVSKLGENGANSGNGTSNPTITQVDETQLLSNLDQLSDEEVNALLERMLPDQDSRQ